MARVPRASSLRPDRFSFLLLAMQSEDTAANGPPVAAQAAAPAPRWRWWVHVILLVLYPLGLGLGGGLSSHSTSTLLPKTVSGLLVVSGVEMLLFSLVFGGAWVASRAAPDALLLRWRGGVWPIARGLGYSVALRVVLALFVLLVAMGVVLVHGASAGALEQLRPKTEVVVDVHTLASNPIYFGLVFTVVSFVVAGLREELWRAGVLAGLGALCPRHFGGTTGRFVAVAMAAVIFGLGHLPQGWGGVVVTAGLGLGLGTIMVLHRSIWDAVFAHGFFNATSFALLPVVAGRLAEMSS